VLPKEEPLIGRVDDQGVLGQTRVVEVVENPADTVVYRGDTTQVVLDVPLIVVPDELLPLKPCFRES
jgi:hypothetical protein